MPRSAFDRHSIRAHPPPLAGRRDFARPLDRPAEQQQSLGQRGLGRVGMRNDRKGAPARNLVGEVRINRLQLLPETAVALAVLAIGENGEASEVATRPGQAACREPSYAGSCSSVTDSPAEQEGFEPLVPP
jgi:hypothetical protein